MSRELITFEVDGEHFAIDIMATREIRAWSPVTRTPGTPTHVAGVINLRGAVLPVIDLAARLGWPPTDASERHAIIVTQLGDTTAGLIVEAVSDIVSLPDEALQPPPPSAKGSATLFIEGIAAVDGKMIMLINLDALADENLTAMIDMAA